MLFKRRNPLQDEVDIAIARLTGSSTSMCTLTEAVTLAFEVRDKLKNQVSMLKEDHERCDKTYTALCHELGIARFSQTSALDAVKDLKNQLAKALEPVVVEIRGNQNVQVVTEGGRHFVDPRTAVPGTGPRIETHDSLRYDIRHQFEFGTPEYRRT